MTPPPPPPPQPQALPPGEPVGFFSARAVKEIPEESLINGQIAPKTGQVFNPRLESPSIRKTPGIDHSKSKPVSRSGQHVPSAVTAAETTENSGSHNPGSGPAPGTGFSRPGPPMGGAGRGNIGGGSIVNPQFDQTRRIGAPGSSSPSANRGQYRPPTMKRPAPGDVPPRVPLTEMPANGPTGAAGGGGPGVLNGVDVKRQKMA